MKIPYQSWGIRTKLIVIFVVIKVLPLVMLALLAWGMAPSSIRAPQQVA